MSRVFISYARSDGKDAAARIAKALSQPPIEVWLDASKLQPASVWTMEIERAIDECDVFVALLSQGSYQSTICRAEQLRALRLAKRVLPVRLQPSAQVPLHLEVFQYIDFSDDDRLDELVRALAGEPLARLLPKYKTTYVTAPPLLRNNAPVTDQLRAAILSDDVADRTKVVAIYGRSPEQLETTAIALCHDRVLQDAFPDGVLWLEAKLSDQAALEQMREAAKVLGDDLSRYDTLAGAINQFRTFIRERSVLVLFWGAIDFAQVQRLVGPSNRSRLVFNAEEPELAQGADFTYELPRARLRRGLPLLAAVAAFAATMPAYLWEARGAFFTSSDEAQLELERQRMHTQDTIGWIFLALGSLLPLSILAVQRFRKILSYRGRRRVTIAAALGIAGILAMIFSDLRFASYHNAELPTVAYPFWAGLVYAITSIWITIRALGISK